MKQIELTKGLKAMVSNRDFVRLNQFSWHAVQTAPGIFYAARSIRLEGRRKMVLMHREILTAPKGLDVDHRDRDRLNNCRRNLRVATRSQNLAAKPTARVWKGKLKSSHYRGVSKGPLAHQWFAQISVHGKKRHLGTFSNSVAAAHIYDNAAKALFGKFAVLNFP